jgi:diguanylate cyclase (GGDEF)-like protein
MLRRERRPDTDYVQERADLRTLIARALDQHSAPIVNDAVAVFPFSGLQGVAADSNNRLAELILQLLAASARDGELDARGELLGDMCQSAAEKGLGIRQLFGLVYLVERAALDELALDESLGATSEPWPALAQLVRRASIDLLSAAAEWLNAGPGQRALVDPLTTLHTRAVLVTALEKEIQRAERFGHPFALILLDVDRLSEINESHGYGSGDRVLERLGILMRKYFREQDWVARYSGDAFAVLLPETQREHAELLAERVRTTVAERIALHDYRSEQQLPVTVSVAVVFAESVDPKMRAERVLDEAREAVLRAKLAGRNRVQKAEISVSKPIAPPRDKNLLG